MNTSMAAECEARLLKLQHYVPFLQRAKEYYISSPEDGKKITQLIAIISNAERCREQLRPETLERCENFCRMQYSKFGKEDELRLRKGNHPHTSHENNRFDNPQHYRAGADRDETPRSPSPEETNRFSVNSVPKAIPNQRTDSDLRINPSLNCTEMVNRDIYRHSPAIEPRPSPSRPLRTEPVEIPIMPLQSASRGQSFSNQDQDYRPAYDQSIANGRNSLEERRVTYRASPELQLGGPSFPKRESRFDRYAGDGRVAPPRSYEEPKLTNQWDGHHSWESHGRDRTHSADTSFQNRGFFTPSHTGLHTARPGTRWDMPTNSQNPHFPSSASRTPPGNRTPHDKLREPISGHSTNSYRTGESPLLPTPRMDRQGVRHEPNHSGKNWSNRDQPRYDHDSSKMAARKYSQNDTSSRQGLHPASSSFPVPHPPMSRAQAAPRVPNYPSGPSQQPPMASSSQGPARREDPRLANRSKSSAPLPSNSTKSVPSVLSQPVQAQAIPSPSTTVHSIPPVTSTPQRFSTSSTPGLSRFPSDSRGNQRQPIKMPPGSPKSGQNNSKAQTSSEVEVRKDVEKIVATVDNASGSSTRIQDEFMSPLDSLYSGASKSGQTGRGYGVQTYKIPKKKTPIADISKKATKLTSETDASTMISSESTPANEISQENTETKDLQIGHDKEPIDEVQAAADNTPIPLEVIENFLKKNLPSDDAKMVLERIKTNVFSDKDVIESDGSPSKKAEECPTPSDSNILPTPAPVSLSGVDATVTSSCDTAVVAMSEDDEQTNGTKDVWQGTSKTVTSSESPDTLECPGKKKGKPRNSLPLELARLREDLTDFMKGGMELGSRRCRSKSSQAAVDATSEDDKMGPSPVKRCRKRKAGGDDMQEMSSFSPVPPSDEGNENLDDSGSTYSSSIEPSSVIESPNQSIDQGQPKSRGRPRKGAVPGKKAGPSSMDVSPDGPVGKAKKRKKPLVPTHLSLRGRRSMYEDAEQENQIDQYFQCQTCSYLGQKIVHHYVNEHPELENPYIAVPENKWDDIQNSPSTTHPHHKLESDLLSDLSWIPARPNYTSPVQCKLCTYHTPKRSELMEHVMIHALPSNCNYRCSLCNFTEHNFFDMLDHIAGHTGEFRYRCNYCNFRVAHRAGIKHHMNSMHESQDGLFYTTKEFPEEDQQLWISGFVCKTCHYVQISEEGLKRHLELHPDCDGHIKVDLINAIEEPVPYQKPETDEDTRAINSPAEKEKGVFLCSPLESVKQNTELDEDELTETLKSHSVSLIETLAEKLTNPETSEEAQSISNRKIENQLPILSDAQKSDTEEEGGCLVIAEDDLSDMDDEKLPAMETAEKVDSVDQTMKDDQPRLLLEAWKPNALLETIISKLTDKLGGSEMEENVSIDFEDEDDVEETEETTEEEEEEEEEEENGDTIEDSESESECETTKEKDADQVADVIAEESSNVVPIEEKIDLKGNDVVDQKIEAFTESTGFLRIESVVSLNDIDEDDSLDPVSSSNLHSNVTMAHEEVKFPYKTNHDRCKLAVKLKDAETYKTMLDRVRIRYLFKCMAYRCMFSSDFAKDFRYHLLWHNKHFHTTNPNQPIVEHRMVSDANVCETLTFPDFNICSYCPFVAYSTVQLVEHVEGNHGSSEFQCSACFFRARRSKVVDLHIIICHLGTDAHTLSCKCIIPSGPPCAMDQVVLTQVPRYRCGIDDCSFTCVLRDSFIKHMSSNHIELKHIHCRLCTEEITCNDSNYTEFFLHMNTHNMGFFQCAFCMWGSDLPTDALIHQCLHHSSVQGKVLIRSGQSTTSYTTLSDHWRPGLPSSYTQAHKIDFHQRFRELFDKVQVVESPLLPEEDVQLIVPEVISCQKKEIDKEVKVQSSTEAGTPLEEKLTDQTTTKESETEFHGFGEEELAKSKEQSECAVVVSDGEDENSASSSIEPSTAGAVQPNEESAELEDHQEGLSGRQLYMCGNIGCDETAENAATFKDHLLVCDLARDSRLLTCRHCGKNIKQVSNLIEHLRCHGVKRFLCGLCSYRSNQSAQIRKHMKTLHRVNIVDEVPIGSGPGQSSGEDVLHALYPREMIARLKLRSRASPGKKGTVKAFTCRDAQTIPMKAILSAKAKCAHCGYTSNVRTNMVRHLSMHQCSDVTNATSSEGEEIIPRVIIPDQDPVNPVPHLETPSQGLMFDKMANLAYSSHVKEKPASKERMSKMKSSNTHDDAVANEKALEPIFIPDHLRYVCGANGCSYLTVNDNMLKYHVQALHKNGMFTCPHCNVNDDEPMPIDAFRGHLKMHGPQLFKCGHCVFYHWHQQDIEYHLKDKHPNRPPWRILIRDPTDVEVKRLQNINQNVDKGAATSMWNCSLCKQVAASSADMLIHVESNHGVKSQYKCALCPVRCNIRSEFDRHFASKHPNQEVQVLTLFFKVETGEVTTEAESTPAVAANFEPLWKKDINRLRHIRGILLDEKEINVSDEGESPPTLMQDDPVFGRYGTPCAMTGHYSCPKCNSYRVSQARDLKIHLYKELDYKKFLCSICNEGAWSRALALSHVGKHHPNSGAYIREITSNKALEDWVGKVIKVQTDALKTLKGTLPSVNKAKKSLPSSPATSAPASPTKSPVKVKKPIAPVLIAPKITYPAKPIVITVSLEPVPEASFSPTKKNWSCLCCQFVSDSAQLLEEHVVSSHADNSTKSGNKICLECGFKATLKQSMLMHQKKSRHSKTNELPTTDEVEIELIPITEVENTTQLVQVQQVKKGKTKTPNPYRCKHCKFSAVNEHGINLHWQRIHSPSDLPLEFECDIPAEINAAKPESAKIYYKCQLCAVQPGLYEEMRMHSRTVHPNCPVKIFRITSKVKSNQQKEPVAVDIQGIDAGPAAKIVRVEKDLVQIREVAPTASSSVAIKSQPPKLTPKTPISITSGNAQTVFVVAPSGNQPTYACAWCNSKFQQESQVIRHHASHPTNVPLRYTCTTPTPKLAGNAPSVSTPAPKPELAVMEIRFGCPICTKYFISLAGAQQHVVEHKQVWKCGHCVMLFGTPTLALQHWKESHPGLQGQLESIDSPSQIVERLSKGITIHRVQLNMKSLLKDKSSLPAQSHSSESTVAAKEVKEKGSTEAPSLLQQSLRTTAVAKKSTSTNLFLKENIKQEPAPSSSRDTPLAVLEVTRIT